MSQIYRYTNFYETSTAVNERKKKDKIRHYNSMVDRSCYLEKHLVFNPFSTNVPIMDKPGS